MNSSFDKAFEKFDECMKLFSKGIEDIFNGKEERKETKIKIKKGSVIYIGQGIHAKLLDDVEATTTSALDKEGNPIAS
jgi:hypothetical protein